MREVSKMNAQLKNLNMNSAHVMYFTKRILWRIVIVIILQVKDRKSCFCTKCKILVVPAMNWTHRLTIWGNTTTLATVARIEIEMIGSQLLDEFHVAMCVQMAGNPTGVCLQLHCVLCCFACRHRQRESQSRDHGPGHLLCPSGKPSPAIPRSLSLQLGRETTSLRGAREALVYRRGLAPWSSL